MTLHAIPGFRNPHGSKKRSHALCAAAAGLDAQPSPRTAGQPQITQGTSTPRARAAGQPYRGGLTGELPSTPSTRRARLDAVDETHNIEP